MFDTMRGMTQYAVIRTDRDHRDYILTELEQNRLRQGWGYAPEQDLREIAKKRTGLTETERQAWGNRRMLGSESDGLQPGDVVICPNLPEYGRWVAARVTGPYGFDDGDPDSGDYRHYLPVAPLRTADGKLAVIHPHNHQVDARLRQTMRNMRRLWSIDYLAEAVERLIRAIASGVDLRQPHSPDERRDAFFANVRASISDAVWTNLQQHVQGAEFEHLLVPIFESVYGSGPERVRAVGGRGEKGADIIVNATDPLGLRFRVGIQVKMHDGTADDDHVVGQLRRAHLERGAHAGVLLTTATTISPGLQAKLTQLADDLDIDIQAWTRDDFVRLLLSYLLNDKDEEAPCQS